MWREMCSSAGSDLMSREFLRWSVAFLKHGETHICPVGSKRMSQENNWALVLLTFRGKTDWATCIMNVIQTVFNRFHREQKHRAGLDFKPGVDVVWHLSRCGNMWSVCRCCWFHLFPHLNGLFRLPCPPHASTVIQSACQSSPLKYEP